QQKHDYLYWENYTYNYNWNKPGSTLPRNWLDSRAVRFGKWKAVAKSTPEGREESFELFNLETDPEEKIDVSSGNPAAVKKIREIFSASSIKDAPFFPYKQ